MKPSTKSQVIDVPVSFTQPVEAPVVEGITTYEEYIRMWDSQLQTCNRRLLTIRDFSDHLKQFANEEK